MARRSRRFRFPSGIAPDAPYYPAAAATATVWAPPVPLAATPGITVVFSSSGYLDVSVPRVRPRIPAGAAPLARRVSPFGHPRISGHLRLPAAFRSLSRPSSPPVAQASPVRPSPAPRLGGRLPPAAPRLLPYSSLLLPRSPTTSTNARYGRGSGSPLPPLRFSTKSRPRPGPPERRYSSRTFRYGYLVTT